VKSEKKNQFIGALEILYGDYVYDSALFGSSNYSQISTDLCYSNSHFTKLISGGATDGMYDRAINNVQKLIKLKRLEEEAAKGQTVANKWVWQLISAAVFLILLIVSYFVFKPTNENAAKSKHPLNMYFDFNDAHYYKSPYLSEEQVHEYCPCSAFEGRWDLDAEYIIPIPYKIPGLYYVGKRADIRLKCRKTSTEKKGLELIGFENIENEIWFDKSMKALAIENAGADINLFEERMRNLNFDSNNDFVKIASVYSCFYDEIQIKNDSIYRTGEPCGRYANADNEEILDEFNLDLNHIIEYVIGKMIFAECAPVRNMFANPNQLKSGESVISFPCKCSVMTENLGLGGAYPYTKSIKLIQQNYQSNLICQ